jgi:hypothetical protein
MKRILLAASLLFLTACDPPQSAEPGASQKVVTGAVTLMATAPDGTKLWAVRSMGRTIYFASTGTSASETCGKNCTYERTTPTAQ